MAKPEDKPDHPAPWPGGLEHRVYQAAETDTVPNVDANSAGERSKAGSDYGDWRGAPKAAGDMPPSADADAAGTGEQAASDAVEAEGEKRRGPVQDQSYGQGGSEYALGGAKSDAPPLPAAPSDKGESPDEHRPEPP